MASRPTCYSIAVSALIALHCQNNSPLYENYEHDPAKVDAFLQKTLIDSHHQLLETVQGPTLKSLLLFMQDFLGNDFTEAFLIWLETAATSVDALVDLMGTVQQALLSSQNAPPNVSASSTNGMYLRAVCLGFDELSFDSVGLLWAEMSKQVEAIRELGLESSEGDIPSSTSASTYSWPLSPAQMEDALQQEIRDLAQHKNLNLEERDSQLQALLEHNPELSSAHFLHFWYSLQLGDRQAAIDALHQYLDTAMTKLENNADPSDNSGNTRILQFAAILAAAFWDTMGDRAQSLAATEEAVRVAQQGGDAACVAFALGWLGIHDKSSASSSQELIQRCVERATQNNLRSLSAGASLMMATQNADQPAVAWSHLLQALTDNNNTSTDMTNGLDRPTFTNNLESGDEALMILARQRLVAAGLWSMMGQAGMSEMTSRIVLQCHSDQLLSQDIAKAVQNIARGCLSGFSSIDVENDLLHSLQRHLDAAVPPSTTENMTGCIYADALDKLLKYQKIFALPLRGVFRLEKMLLLHEWAVRRGDFIQAEDLGVAMNCHLCPRIANYDEIKLDVLAQRALLLSRQEKWDDAKSLTLSLVKQCKEERRHDRHARFLLQLVSIHLESAPSRFTGALPYLMECLSLSEKSHMNGLHACALALLGQVHLRRQNPKRAIATVRAALSPLLQHEHVCIQGEAFFTLAECHLRLADEPTEPSLEHVRAGIKMLLQALDCFHRCQDCVRLKKTYYLLAKSFDRLPDHQKQRDAAAENFLSISKYLVQALGPSKHSVLSSLDNTPVLESLIARIIPITGQ